MRSFRCISAFALLAMSAAPAFALTPEEREFFGLTALEASHPEIDGSGFSFAVSDTEFDLTHPGLGWTSAETYAQWHAATNSITNLVLKNARVASAANRYYCATSYTNRHHGVSLYAMNLPVQNNNTLQNFIWGIHGTAVAGTAGSGTNGLNGESLGVAPKARLVFASDTEDFQLSAGQVPDGNPFKTVAINRSFTGSSTLPVDARRNSGLVTVNAAGNDFGNEFFAKTTVYGQSPHLPSIRWLQEKGYDLIASGIFSVSTNGAINAAYGSQRNPESIWTDFSIATLSPNGQMDAYWSGTSFAAPFTVGGVTLLQQAYANSHSGLWLRVDQVARILRASARFMDDVYTGLRCPVAKFDAAVALATNYPGDPSLEPNFTATFADTNRVNYFDTDPRYPNPNYFRIEPAYGSGTYDFTAPTVSNQTLRFFGNTGPGQCNIALRNGWGDLSLVDLSATGKMVAMAFEYDTNPGWVSGTTETYLGLKEMVGSDQFMNDSLITDAEPIGRLAFRIIAYQGADTCTVQALRCSELPFTNDVLWARPNSWVVPVWDAPLASATVTNLTLGNMSTVTVEFTATHMRFLRGETEIMNVAHSAPSFALARSTPYLHFKHSQTDHLTRVRNFSVQTTSAADPVVTLVPRRLRALEGVADFSPAAVGIVSINRAIATNAPLTVHYTVSGTASNGADFAALSGSLTIPANVAEADLAIRPLNDGTPETDETVVVQLSAGAGYTLGSATTATITLVDFSDADADRVANTNEDRNTNGNLLDDDTDLDMLPNYLDGDDDGDHVNTTAEDRNANNNPADDDTDGDLTPNYLDADDDGDGYTTLQEDRNRNGDPADDDYDHDGTPDYLDTDPVPYSDFLHMAIPGSFNTWSTSDHEMTLVGNGLWQRNHYFVHATGVQFKFAADLAWTVNWGDDVQTNANLPISDVGDPGGSNITVNGTLNGTYLITFNDATRAYSVQFVPPTDNDNDGMADDWETANGLNPGSDEDADDDPDLDGFTNLQEYQNGTDPHAWDPHLTSHLSMSVAATFNNWNAGANNMSLVDDNVWRFVGNFETESNVQFKFAANGDWTTNWGDNDQADFIAPLTNGVGEASGANIVISNTLDGLYAFTFNESSRAYNVTATCDEFCDLVTGVTQVVSLGTPGPIMGATPAWKAIAGGDHDASTPSGFVLARTFGSGRVVAFGHDGLPQQLNELDNRPFMVNVIQWLNDAGGKQVAYSTGHGEWVQGAQLADLASEMTNRGYAFAPIAGALDTNSLAGRDVLIIGNAWQPFDYAEYYAVQTFVTNGGSVLLLGLGWSWNGAFFDDYPMNRMGEGFQLRWLRDYITDASNQTNGSPIFHTFYPRVPYYSLEEATTRVAQVHAAHPADLPSALETDEKLRRQYLVAQGALAGASRDFYTYAYERYGLFEFCNGQAAAYPQYFSKTNVFNTGTQPVMSRMRERFLRTWMDAVSLYDYSKAQFATNAQLFGAYSNLWSDFTIYLMDNTGLDSTQQAAIHGLVDAIPETLHNARAISVDSLIGASTPAVSLNGRDGQINLFDLEVGASTENQFPDDVAPRVCDVFSIVLAHEMNHLVDAYTINGATNLKTRKEQLIAAAGTNRFHYLRGGNGLPLGDGFFTQNPQEFFASIANQWFADSEQVFELGYVRFTNGIPHPINQALFFADIYSRRGPTTWFYTLDASGQLSNKTARLVRDTNDLIRALSTDMATWFFEYNGSGYATNAIKTDGTGDRDGDGIADRWEIDHDLNPLDAVDAARDIDEDGLTNLQEFNRNTNPQRPDTDFDGKSDLFDSQPLVSAFPQYATEATHVGTATKSSYRWTVYFMHYDYAFWGAPSYSVSEGFARFDVGGIPDNAVIRNIAMRYDSGAYAFTYYGAQPVNTEIVALDATDPMPPATAEPVYSAISTAALLQVSTGTNAFPFRDVADWGANAEANLASRLGADTWSLGFRNSSNYQFYAYVSNVALVVSYETNGAYASSHATMTMAGTLNGWNPVANNMLLVSNYLWRYEGDVRNVSGVQIKFAANRSWDTNWGDNNQADLDPALTGAVESAGANIVINGTLDGTLRVTFNEQTAAYAVEILPRLDSDSDGMPDEWEFAYGLSTNVNDAAGNPDGDLFTNLQEYQHGTNPFAWNPPNSQFSTLSVVGTFNNWEAAQTNMTLVSNYLWRFDLPVTNLPSLQFKFAANADWGVNWGDNNQPGTVPPFSGDAERDGGNIQVNGPIDGTLRFTFFESATNYAVDLLPPLDSDTDGMPDYWEDLHGLDKTLSTDAGLDPDDDGFTNLSEYQHRTNPNVPDAMVSNYTNMSVAADFNGWNAGANNMHLVDHYTWQYTIGLDLPAGAEFKFAAEGTWAVNWGETNQPAPFTDPLQGDAETNGGNIFVSGPLNGTYVFQFNDNSRAYRFTRSQVPDFDQDGMTDDWEDSHGFDARNGSDAGIDSDNDLLINLDEFRNVTDPHDADTDNDGATDLDEVVAGTQAADPASKLMLGGVATGGMFRVTWPGASGRTYNLLQSADLQGGPWSPVTGHTNLGGVNGTMNADVSVTPGPSVFYRIDVRKNTP